MDAASLAFFEQCQAGWDCCRGGYVEVPWRPWHLWRGKIWWVQAEALLASLLLARFGNTLAELRLPRLMHWIEKHQIDSHYLEWHAVSSRPLDNKAGPWNPPDYLERCLLEGLSLKEWNPGNIVLNA